MTESKDLYVRRGLWEEAVIAYARCFRTGRRRKLPEALKAQMGENAVRVHKDILKWADKHVAHRVDRKLEPTEVTLTYAEKADVPSSVRVRVEFPIGPEDERLANGLSDLAKGLKDRLWEQWFPKLEHQLLVKYRTDDDKRSSAAVYPQAKTPGRVVLTIDPTGRLPSK
jgi:hypothetical protein